MPESPIILTRRNKPAEAIESISKLRNLHPASSEMAETVREIQQWLSEQESFGPVRVTECFKGTNLRRTLLGMGMAFMTIASGVTFWFGYGTTFFEAAGVEDSYLVSLILAVVNCALTLPSVYLVEKVGRRSCMFLGGGVMGLAYLLTGVIHNAAPGSSASHSMLIAGAVIFISFYAATWGPVGKCDTRAGLLTASLTSGRLGDDDRAVFGSPEDEVDLGHHGCLLGCDLGRGLCNTLPGRCHSR